MTRQDRIDDRHLVVTRLASNVAQQRVSVAIDRLAEARADQGNADWTLVCSRALNVAQQQHVEALAELAAAQRARGANPAVVPKPGGEHSLAVLRPR
jgi:hypothetical protein